MIFLFLVSRFWTLLLFFLLFRAVDETVLGFPDDGYFLSLKRGQYHESYVFLSLVCYLCFSPISSISFLPSVF